jgi:hypothetical protein
MSRAVSRKDAALMSSVVSRKDVVPMSSPCSSASSSNVVSRKGSSANSPHSSASSRNAANSRPTRSKVAASRTRTAAPQPQGRAREQRQEQAHQAAAPIARGRTIVAETSLWHPARARLDQATFTASGD